MITVIKYTPINKGVLVGFVDIFVEKWGLEVYGIQLFQKNGKRWINFPSRTYEKEGEKKYLPYLRFKESIHFEEFSKQVMVAIEKDSEERFNKTPQEEEVQF